MPDPIISSEQVTSNAVITGLQHPNGSQGIFDASVTGDHTTYVTFTAPPDVSFRSALGYSYAAPVNAVPEPSALLLLGLGLVGLAAWQWKRQGTIHT